MRTVPLVVLSLLLIAPVAHAADDPDDSPGSGATAVSDDSQIATLATESSEGDFEGADEEERVEAALRSRDPAVARIENARASYKAREGRAEGPALALARECLGDATRAGTVDWFAADSCSRRRISALRATK